MDHALYDYSALPSRAPLRWPHGAHVAFCPVVVLDDWMVDPPAGAICDPRFVDPHGDFRPDNRTATWREYGLRIGIYRVFDVMDRHRHTATLAVGSAVARRCPNLVEEALSRGWDVAGHGEHGNAMISSAMSRDEIADHVGSCLDDVAAVCGTRPVGWVSQDYGQSAETPQVLAEAGIRWIADWPNDEQPYLMSTTPPLASLPVLSELDDVQLLWHRRVLAPRYPHLVGEAVEVLARDGATTGRAMVLPIHPWLTGVPHRIRYLERAMAELADRADVWRTNCGSLAKWFANGAATP